jgi:hypothetical protein
MGRYRWRTEIRRKLPWFMIDLGITAKGRRDCGRHEWYREHDNVWRCNHCKPGEYVGEDPYVSEVLRDLG